MIDAKSRVIAGSLVMERPSDTVRPEANRDVVTSFAIFICRPLWALRVELVFIGVVAGLVFLARQLFGVAGVFLAAVALAGLLLNNWSRPKVSALFHRRSIRRAFDKACRYALVVSLNDRTPTIKSLRSSPAGDVLTVQMPPGLSTAPLVDASEVIASALSVRDVKIERQRQRADLATVQIVSSDPLEDPKPVAWPNLSAERMSIWEPIPLGFNELGEVEYLSLAEKMILIGGEPGAGKSVGLSELVATAALDPLCKLSLLDGKQVELAPWRGCADHIVGPSLKDAIDLLHILQTEMDQRYEILLAFKKRKIERNGDMPMHVVVCDELAYYLNMGDRKETQEFERCLRDLVARGRAAGIVVIVATQKPSHDVIPTSIRDLFSVRWALRCSTPQASDTILGQGWASQDFSAADIDSGCRGVGYLLHEGGQPVRIRSYYLSDDDLSVLAHRGEALRSSAQEGVVTSIAELPQQSAYTDGSPALTGEPSLHVRSQSA